MNKLNVGDFNVTLLTK